MKKLDIVPDEKARSIQVVLLFNTPANFQEEQDDAVWSAYRTTARPQSYQTSYYKNIQQDQTNIRADAVWRVG
jgi:hypothetical protein